MSIDVLPGDQAALLGLATFLHAAGAVVRAIGEWAADAPPQVLGSLGIRRDPLTRRFEPLMRPPSAGSLERIDAGAFDAAVGSWLAGRLAARQPGKRARRALALAVDGKSLRGTRHASAEGQATHLLAVCDPPASAVLARSAWAARPTR